MRRATAARRCRLRRCSTTRRWSRKACSASFRFITRGTPSGSSTLRLSGTRISSSVSRNSCSISIVGIDIAGLRLEDEADILGRFVADIGEQRQLLLFEQRRDLLDQPAFLHLIRHLGDDDLVEAVAQRLRRPARPQAEAAAAGRIGLANAVRRLDQDAAGREIGAGHMRDELVDRAGRAARSDAAARRRARRHCAAGCWSPCRRRCRRRRWRAGSGSAPAGRPARCPRRHRSARKSTASSSMPVEHRLRHRRQPALGVAHRRGVIAVDIAEIALPVDQRIALREILREAHQRVIDRDLAMRMELADHVADDAGAFLVARGRDRGAAAASRAGCGDAPASARRAHPAASAT